MRRCERAGCSEPSSLVLSVEIPGRVIYWDPVPLARRAGTPLCYAHATEVAVPENWVICDRRGRTTVIHVPPIAWEALAVVGADRNRSVPDSRQRATTVAMEVRRAEHMAARAPDPPRPGDRGSGLEGGNPDRLTADRSDENPPSASALSPETPTTKPSAAATESAGTVDDGGLWWLHGRHAETPEPNSPLLRRAFRGPRRTGDGAMSGDGPASSDGSAEKHRR